MAHQMAFPDLTWRRADLTPHSIAVIDTGTGLELTYEDLEARAGSLAVWLRDEWHVEAGERVAIIAMNGAATLEWLFACTKVGALLVPLNWRLSVQELADVLHDCSPRALIHGPEFVDTTQALVQGVGIEFSLALDGARDGSYAAALSYADGKTIHMPERSHDHPWGLLYTSGTTGRTKGVIQTMGMVLTNYLNCGLAIGLTASDRTLNVLPQFHTAGLNLYTLPTLLAGGTAIIQRAFDPQQTLRLLAERVTAFVGVPAMYRALQEHPDFDNADFSQMRSWGSGGAPMAPGQIQSLADRGIRIQQSFGMTETGPTVCLMDQVHAVSKMGSVGKPQLFVEVKLIDSNGDVVRGGGIGEMLVRGPAVTPGYWNQPRATSEAIDADGWLRSGDIAQRDDDGYYTIVDRRKNMYISGGENVYPAEVENVLAMHPAIAEVAVLGVEDERWGEVGLAVVVPQPAHSITVEEVAAFCAGKLARYKIPKHVVEVPALPRNATGKVLRHRIPRDVAP